MTQPPNSVPCPRCLAVHPAGANFCSRCGIGLNRPPLAGNRSQKRAAVPPPPQKAKVTGLWPLVVVAMIGLQAFKSSQHGSSSHPQLRYNSPLSPSVAPVAPAPPGLSWPTSGFPVGTPDIPAPPPRPWSLQHDDRPAQRD